MLRSVLLPAALSGLLLSAGHAAAQDVAQDPVQTTVLDEVVVDALRAQEMASELDAQAQQFVESVSEGPRNTVLARWHIEMCVAVHGMRADAAQFVIDRIAVSALQNGVQFGEPGCRPNVVIMATANGRELAGHLVDSAGLAFRPADSATQLNARALEQFRSSEVPVRWWHISAPYDREIGAFAVRRRGEEANTYYVRHVGRTRSNFQRSFAWSIIVVDMSKTGGVPLGGLADYLALVALTQADAQADHSAQDTILNLFDGSGGVAELTSWDRDYLSSLYAAEYDRVSVRSNNNNIADRLSERRQRRLRRQPSR